MATERRVVNIPDKAVEAAARASYPAWRAKAFSAGVEAPATFDDLPDQIKTTFYDDIHPALDAAFPVIASRVLRDQAAELRAGFDARVQESGVDLEGFDAEWLNVAEHIESRADELGKLDGGGCAS